MCYPGPLLRSGSFQWTLLFLELKYCSFFFPLLDMHPLAAASRSSLLCSKRPIMSSALNVSLRKTWMSDIALNQSINYFICRHITWIKAIFLDSKQMLSNTKLRHFWAQIVSWAPRHARKSFIVLAPGRGSQFTERWRHLTCCNEPNCLYGSSPNGGDTARIVERSERKYARTRDEECDTE